MRTRKHPGMTLVEALMVLSIFMLVFIAITTLVMQANRVYARTSGRIEPQQSMMLALKRMEREMREAMSISPMPNETQSNWVEIILPKRDANGYLLTKVTEDRQQTDPVTGVVRTVRHEYMALQPGDIVRYYLAERPGGGAIDTIYRAQVSSTGTLIGTPKVIVSGVATDPKIFTFSPVPTGGNVSGATLITIRLTVPVNTPTAQGMQLINQTLSTQFRMRNCQSAT